MRSEFGDGSAVVRRLSQTRPGRGDVSAGQAGSIRVTDGAARSVAMEHSQSRENGAGNVAKPIITGRDQPVPSPAPRSVAAGLRRASCKR
jgi:hypothetical protein